MPDHEHDGHVDKEAAEEDDLADWIGLGQPFRQRIAKGKDREGSDHAGNAPKGRN